jgi:hypothetical protein
MVSLCACGKFRASPFLTPKRSLAYLLTKVESMSTFSLLGWDTANVIGFNQINPIIYQQKSFPNSSVPVDYTASTGDKITGCTFDYWALTNGGADTNLFIKAKPNAGTIQIGSTTVALAGKLIVFQINLTFYNETGDSSDPYLLKVDATKANVSVQRVDYGTDASLPDTVKFNFVGVFQEYLNAHLADFTQVFHSALLQPADGTLPWVKPSGLGYAVSNGLTEANCLFSVLTTTEGRTPTNLNHQIDARLLTGIPSGANAAFVISQEMLTKHLLLPGALAVFGSGNSDNFKITDDGMGVENVNSLTWGKFLLKDGDPSSEVSPTIPPNGFSIAVAPEGDRIRMTFTGVNFATPATLGGNIITTMSFSQDLFLAYDKAKDQLVPTFVNPANPQDQLTINDVQISAEPDSTASAIEWVEIGIGAALILVGVAGAAGAAYISRTSRAAAVAGNVANANVNGTQLNIIYSQLPANPPPNFVPPPVAAAPAAAGALQGVANTSWAATAPWKTGLLATVGFLGGLTGLGLGVAKLLKDQTLADLAKGNADGTPAFSTFTSACFEKSTWPDMKSWTPVDVKLNGVLIIYGNLATNTP